MCKFGLKIQSGRTVMKGIVCLAAALAGVAAAEDQMVVVRREDAKFVPVDPARPNEAQIAVLWGDPTTGPSSMLLRVTEVHRRSALSHVQLRRRNS